MISTAAEVMQMSATLKIAKCGNWKKSTTWPRKTPGARNSRSIRLPAIPAQSSPRATAQPVCASRGTNRIPMKINTPTAKKANT